MDTVVVDSVVAPRLWDVECHSNPYPYYEALREAGPIHWSDEFFGGAWLLTRHADVEMVLRDPRFSAQRTGAWVNDREGVRGEFSEFQSLFARALLFLDAPDHPRIRRVLQAGFKPEMLHRLRPRIEHAVDELLNLVPKDRPFDFIESVAKPLPIRVIGLLLGIEDQTHEEFVIWSNDLATFIGVMQPNREQTRNAQRSLVAMGRYFEDLIRKKREQPGDDLVSQLLQAQLDGEIRDGAELVSQCAMLLFAGFETTRHLLGSGVHALLSHPAQWKLLQQEPDLLPSAVRELLRYESPVQYTGRRVSTDLELHGTKLCKGDLVLPLIGAANRDPSRYSRPDVLDIQRSEGNALSFGSGAHVCLGAALTRMEVELVFEQILKCWPNLRLMETYPSWIDKPVYRGLTTLSIRI